MALVVRLKSYVSNPALDSAIAYLAWRASSECTCKREMCLQPALCASYDVASKLARLDLTHPSTRPKNTLKRRAPYASKSRKLLRSITRSNSSLDNCFSQLLWTTYAKRDRIHASGLLAGTTGSVLLNPGDSFMSPNRVACHILLQNMR